ncbi:hypothetical protein FRC20_005250, partial [Serendipita sp. 405]
MSSSSPIGPPPPSTTDDDTSQLVDQALAQRQSQSRTGWNRLSLTHTPITPLTPYFRKKTEPEPSSSNNNERAENATGTTSTPDRAGRSSPARQDTIREEGNERSTKSPSKISKRGTMKRNMTSGSIKLEGLAEASPAGVSLKTPQKALYRYADVYENQRGWARMGMLKFSSRALNIFFHYKDPAPFTKFEQTENGLEEVDLPYNSLDDVQLPSADWCWHGSEWLIDMAGDGMTSYDGFQYNTHFRRMKGWSPVAPKWHSYLVSCCRRRRWLRLMVYLPSVTTSDASGKFHSPTSHIPTASEPTSPWPGGYSAGNTPIGLGFTHINETEGEGEGDVGVSPTSPRSLPPSALVDVTDIWRGDGYDWVRAHAGLKLLKSDGRRLELWTGWLGDEGEQEEDITGMRRFSLERRREAGEMVESGDQGKGKGAASKGKGKRVVQWTEDEGRSTLKLNTSTTPDQEDPMTAKGAMSLFMAEEPLEVDSSLAPREYVRVVLKEH